MATPANDETVDNCSNQQCDRQRYKATMSFVAMASNNVTNNALQLTMDGALQIVALQIR
jgi:type 1 fimbria pilin